MRRPLRIDVERTTAAFAGHFAAGSQTVCATGLRPRVPDVLHVFLCGPEELREPIAQSYAASFIASRNLRSRGDARYAVRPIQSRAPCC
ncbi:hypothetical protein BTO02_12270 [Paraburkholderia sp. SOS3]|nr:hypothetical protein BTO02_12270 [Paraburkholderia sp. SOS3]